MEKIFIGVAWPYVSGYRHLGHVAGFGVPCDIFARYHRLKGNDSKGFEKGWHDRNVGAFLQFF